MKQEKCTKCKKKSVWVDYTHKNYCEQHFIEQIEKRIRKHLRINKIIDVKKTYYLQPDKENKHLLTKFFLENIFQSRLKVSNKKNENTLVSDTLDDEAEQLMYYFLKNQEMPKGIKPINVITDAEAQIISEIIKIPLKIKPKLQEELTKKDPQLLFSLHKSKQFIEQRIKDLEK